MLTQEFEVEWAEEFHGGKFSSLRELFETKTQTVLISEENIESTNISAGINVITHNDWRGEITIHEPVDYRYIQVCLLTESTVRDMSEYTARLLKLRKVLYSTESAEKIVKEIRGRA